MADPARPQWWREFFENPDSLELSSFPSRRETEREVRGLIRLVGLSRSDRIADICCGYGRHLARLAARGYAVIGLDASEMMLAGARATLMEFGVSAPLIRGDAAQLPFADASLDVVLNLFNSFGYFLDDGQNVRVLQEAARVLKPGGRFFLDTRNRPFQILYAPYRQPVTTADGRRFILRCTYDRSTQRMTSRWIADDDPQRVVHEAVIRLYGLEELRELMAEAGFEEVAVYGTYLGDPFEGFHRQLLYLARKRQ